MIDSFFNNKERYLQIKTIAEMLRPSDIERDVVISNLYLHLKKNEKKITKENFFAYSVRFCKMLNYWCKNRGQDIMEEKYKGDDALSFDTVSYKVSSDNDTIEYGHLKDVLKAFKETLSKSEIKLLDDVYGVNSHAFISVENMVKFMGYSKTKAYNVNKKIKLLENKMFIFTKKNKIL